MFSVELSTCRKKAFLEGTRKRNRSRAGGSVGEKAVEVEQGWKWDLEKIPFRGVFKVTDGLERRTPEPDRKKRKE